ncbi:hypothetical protein PC116_g3937 [Phytophthora cactorum]|uniref:Uncharacterized protein n=1 Tax=Phytophthora cactorum TaxID=29920 RepID=A0A8T1LL32_9STRA|nr:hypothetical protein PC111_g7525 [Phytophthora cactorum]KAG2832676.1 hypothetical protein PC112_g6806 [Phytophthora cactorum]KAG2911482.1 hypothetical protein PC114_g9341 [Phytophthora cactorum]KAG2944217.1 hypothetical protein PC117_g9138 [Phytophthora cactorum]KAG3023484.1 hypothetical protein PC119_g8895 [Phytophthora cactorum]
MLVATFLIVIRMRTVVAVTLSADSWPWRFTGHGNIDCHGLRR